MLRVPVPSAAATATASKSGGNDISRSIRRMTSPAIRAELTPATIPSSTPGSAAPNMVRSEAMRLTRAPKTTRLRTSRPSWSVPNQWPGPGDRNRCPMFSFTGLANPSSGATNARRSRLTTIRLPASESRFRRS